MTKTKIIMEVGSTEEAINKMAKLIEQMSSGELFVLSVDGIPCISTKDGTHSGSSGYWV